MEAAAPFKQKFLDDHPDYAVITPNSEIATIGEFQDIDLVEDELWFVQCPKDVDLSTLEGQKLKLPGRTTAADELEAVAVDFSTEPEQHAFGYCNRKGRYAMRLLPVRGSIILRSRLKASEALTTEQIESSMPPPGRVPVPDAIKVRHPLLGYDFEEKLRLDKATSARLKRADEVSLSVTQEARNKREASRKTAVKQKKRGVVLATIAITSDDDDEVDSVSKSAAKKKKKKRKHSESVIDVDVEYGSPKKSKKEKKSTKFGADDVSADLQWLKEL